MAAVLGIAIILLVVVGPLGTIWSLNTLFGLSVPMTFQTWLATLILSGLVYGSAGSSKS